jgi:hypothetical protein
MDEVSGMEVLLVYSKITVFGRGSRFQQVEGLLESALRQVIVVIS